MRFIMTESETLTSLHGAGRPSKAQAMARHDQLLAIAYAQFAAHGFEQTTIDGIAAAIGMTKRTIYARYADKAALFRAAIARASALYAMPVEAMAALETDDLAATLTAIAHARLAHLEGEDGAKLQRLLMAETYRFPGMLDDFYSLAVAPMTAFLSDLLSRRTAIADWGDGAATNAAIAFLSLVIGGPARTVIGGGIAPADLDARVRFSVQIFLNGLPLSQ